MLRCLVDRSPAVRQPIRKAVFPAAGLGTRFLPATKAQPKEMLPLVDKPIIQYGVEEAVASGVDNIILVTGRGKNAIEDHFDVSVELETFLEARGKTDLLAEIRKISNLINFSYVRQGEPLGLGHAVLVTRDLVGDEPFAVILGDDVIDADAARAEADDRRLPRSGRAGARGRARAARRRQLVRHHRRRRSPAGRVPHPRSGGEAAARGGAVRPGDHRPLHPDAGHLPGARSHGQRSDRGDSAHQRPAAPVEGSPDLRLPRRWRPPRHRQQAWLPEGRGLFRAATAGPRRAVRATTCGRSTSRNPRPGAAEDGYRPLSPSSSFETSSHDVLGRSTRRLLLLDVGRGILRRAG